MRYELSDCEWSAIKPFLPNKPCGVPCVNDRRALNGIFWILRLVLTLLSALKSEALLLADRGYDADWIRTFVSQHGAGANIPPKRSSPPTTLHSSSLRPSGSCCALMNPRPRSA